MARTKAREPGIRIDGDKRINLVDLRQRKKLARENAKPVEDTRVSDAWGRAEARERSRLLDAQEIKAIKKQQNRPVEAIQVENPLWQRDHAGASNNYRHIEAEMNPRESSITAMKIRGILDEAQARSALRFCQLWERLGGKGASAIDYSREPVDGGRIAEPINIAQMEAGRELKRCRALLGDRGYRLVSQVCGEGYQVSELVEGKRAQLSMMDGLRGFLDDLAVMWNYAQPARSVVRK